MGLLDEVLRGALGARQGSGTRPASSMSPVVTAILALIAGRAFGGSQTERGGGGLDSVLGGLGGLLSSGSQTGMSGGLNGLLDRFRQAGHGDAADSWVGTGQNRPIAPDQLGDVLGGDAVSRLSNETGLPRQDLLSQLSQALPDVIDRLTPQGRVPSDDELGQG